MKKISLLHFWNVMSNPLFHTSLGAFRLLSLLFIGGCSGSVAVVSKIDYDVSDPSKTAYFEKVDDQENKTYREIKHQRIVFREDQQATVKVTGFNPLNTSVSINAKTYNLFSTMPGAFEQAAVSPAQGDLEAFVPRTHPRTAITEPSDFLALHDHYKQQVNDSKAIADDMKKLIDVCLEFTDRLQSLRNLSQHSADGYEKMLKNTIVTLHNSGRLAKQPIEEQTAISSVHSYATLITTRLAEISLDLTENINAVKKLQTDGILTSWEKQAPLSDQPDAVAYIKSFESSKDFANAEDAFNYGSDKDNLEKLHTTESLLVSLNTLDYTVTSALKSPKGGDRMYFIVSLLDQNKSVIKSDTVPDGGLKVQGIDIDFSAGPFWSQLYDQGYFITQRTQIASVQQVNDAGEIENINKELPYSRFGEKTEDNYSLGVMTFAHGRFKGYRTIQPGFYLGIGAFFQDKARPVFSAGGSLHFIAFDQRFCLNAGYAWAQVKRLHPKYVVNAEYQESFTEVPREEERDGAFLVSLSYNFNQRR